MEPYKTGAVAPETVKRVVGKLPKERIPVVRKEETRVLFLSSSIFSFEDTQRNMYQKPTKTTQKVYLMVRIWVRQRQEKFLFPLPQSFSVQKSFSVQNIRLTRRGVSFFTRGDRLVFSWSGTWVEKVMFKSVSTLTRSGLRWCPG